MAGVFNCTDKALLVAPPEKRVELTVMLQILNNVVRENRKQEEQLSRLIGTLTHANHIKTHKREAQQQIIERNGEATFRDRQEIQAQLKAQLAKKTHDLEVCRTVLSETRKDMAKLKQEYEVFKILHERKEQQLDHSKLKLRSKALTKPSSSRKRKGTIRSSFHSIPAKRSQLDLGDNGGGVEDLDLFADHEAC